MPKDAMDMEFPVPVYKFRTFEEARQALWHDGLDKRYLQRVAKLWAFSARFKKPAFPPGVYKYRNITEASQEREHWTKHLPP